MCIEPGSSPDECGLTYRKCGLAKFYRLRAILYLLFWYRSQKQFNCAGPSVPCLRPPKRRPKLNKRPPRIARALCSSKKKDKNLKKLTYNG